MRIIGTRLSLLVACVALVAGPAFAQAPKPTAPPDAAHDAKSTAPAENLSKKLNQSNGVIHPEEVDPAIEKGRPSCTIRTWSLRQGLQAALPRRSQNEATPVADWSKRDRRQSIAGNQKLG